MSKTNLFDDFSEVSAKAWKQKIQVDLKGADYNNTLVWESPEGIKTKPFYNAEDTLGENSFSYQQKDAWKIGQTIFCKNARKANKKAIDALNRGAQSLILIIPSSDIDISILLSDIELATIPIHFDFQFLDVQFIEQLLNQTKNSVTKFFFNIDILGHLARSGNWHYNLKEDYQVVEKIIDISTKSSSTVLSVDTSLYQNAGATAVQQIAYAAAHANEYLNHFNQEEVGVTKNIGVNFKVAVGGNYFFEIAKLRALRWVWESLAAEYGISVDCHILAVPSRRNKTLYDYNTNMLRTTTECMSAILGGADTVCNATYDAIYHKDNEFAERIARNQLLILQEESYFDKVNNPADGSYYIESLTKQMAEKAINLFKSIETSGGFLKQLKEHTIQKKIVESAAKEQQRFNAGEDVLVGTNAYQNEDDKMKDNLELYPFIKTAIRKTLIAPIIEKRLAENLEQQRLKDE